MQLSPVPATFSRKFILLFTVFILFLGLASCEYKLHDLYQNPTVEGAGEPMVNIVDLNLDQDTVYMYADRNVTFRFTSSDQEIQTIRFLVDGEVKDTVNSNQGEFLLVINDFYSGIHDLSLQVLTGSGTGSIAEQLGAEGYYFENHWVLVVIHNASGEYTHTAENGYLHLNFPAMQGHDIKEYVIYRRDGNSVAHDIGHVWTNHFIDTCYVGEGGYYTVHAILNSGQDLFWGYWLLDPELPRLSFSATETNQYFMYWSGCKYYNGITSIKAYASKTFYGNYDLLHTSYSPSDSVAFLNGYKFGDEFTSKIELVPKAYSFTYVPNFDEYYFTYDEVMAGYRFANYIYVPNLIKTVESNQILFSDQQTGLMKYSLSDLTLRQSILYEHSGCNSYSFSDVCVSPFGKFFTAHVCDFNQVYSASTSDITNYNVGSMSFLTGQYSPDIPVSDNHIGLVNSIIGGVYLYNFDTQSVEAEYPINPTVTSGVCISSNADYMIIYEMGIYKLMHYSNHQFTQLQTYDPDVYNSFEFSSVANEQFSYWDGQFLSIIRASDQSVLSKIDISGERFLAVDYKNHEALTGKGQHLLVRSTDTGELLHDVPINDISIYEYYHCSLSDHKILSNKGVLYFL